MNIIFLFVVVSQLNLEQLLIKTVENDLQNTEYEWTFNSLQNFPICFQCRTILPCCLDFNSYGLNNWIYKKNEKECLVGIRYKIIDDLYCFSVFQYNYVEGIWEFSSEKQMVIVYRGEILKDYR
jgi:hypothetical protein